MHVYINTIFDLYLYAIYQGGPDPTVHELHTQSAEIGYTIS
jgi:hypothetical protein